MSEKLLRDELREVRNQLAAVVAERDAVVVENAEMRSVIDAAVAVAGESDGIAGWHLDGEIADWDEILPELNIETPATDAAIAAIKKQAGVEAVEEAAYSLYGKGYVFDTIMDYAEELREGQQ